MSMSHLVMYLLFTLQLLLLSLWLPQRCQQVLKTASDMLTTTANKRRQMLVWLNMLLLVSGIVLLVFGVTGRLAQPVPLLVIFTLLQVLLLLTIRQWLPNPPVLASKRKASLQRRTVWDFISVPERLLAVLSALSVPSLALFLAQTGLWFKDVSLLWQLVALSLLADLVLCVAIYLAVFRPKAQQNPNPELVELREVHIQRGVDRHLKSVTLLHLVLLMILLLSATHLESEWFFSGISVFIQLMLSLNLVRARQSHV